MVCVLPPPKTVWSCTNPLSSLPSNDATQRSPVHASKVYSPECVEGEFCELRVLQILGRSHAASYIAPAQHLLQALVKIQASREMPCYATSFGIAEWSEAPFLAAPYAS